MDMDLPDFEWSLANIQDEDKVRERSIDDISVSKCERYDVEEFISENFGDDKIYLEPIPIEISNQYSSAKSYVSTPTGFPREVICYLQEKGVETIKVETPTTLKWFKNEYKPPMPRDRVWYGWKGFIDQLDEDSLGSVRRNNYETRVEYLKNSDSPPDKIKKGFTTSEEEVIWERKDYSTNQYINSPQDAVEVAKTFFDPSWGRERWGVIFLDKDGQVLKKRILNEGEEDHVSAPSIYRLNNLIEQYGASQLIHIHNHPNMDKGHLTSTNVYPSEADKRSYKKMKEGDFTSEPLEANLYDSIILGAKSYSKNTWYDYYSFRLQFDKTDMETIIEPSITLEWSGKARDKVEYAMTHDDEEKEFEEMFEKKTRIEVFNIDQAEEFLHWTNSRGNYIFSQNQKLVGAAQERANELINKLEDRGYQLDGESTIVNHY